MATGTETIGQVFQQKGLWQWWTQNGGLGTQHFGQYFNGEPEKGIDYANAFGTPIGVPVGGTIIRMVHNNNSLGDVVEMQCADGSVMLYQHITARVQVGTVLGVGSIIGTENGLPIDAFSSGPHIEVRYCPPGRWSSKIDSWNEPWINPFPIFSVFSNQIAGTVGGGGGITGGGVFGIFFGSNQGQMVEGPPVLKHLASNADVTAVLMLLDQACAIVNPFAAASAAAQVDTIQGTISVGPVNVKTPSISFSDPMSWLTDFGIAMVDDLVGLFFRGILIALGVILVFKVITGFVDFGKYFSDAQGIIAKVGTLAA